MLLRDAALSIDNGPGDIDRLASVVISLIEQTGQGRSRVFSPRELLAASRRSRDASGLLIARAMSVLGPPEVATKADAVVRRLVEVVSPGERDQLAQLGRIEPLEATATTQVHHDSTVVSLRARHPNGDSVEVRFTTEAAFSGAATTFGYGQRFLSRSSSDEIVEELTLPDARAWLDQGLATRAAEYTVDFDDQQDLMSLDDMAIVVHYFNQCPPGGRLPDRARLTDENDVPDLIAEFLASPEAVSLVDADALAPKLAEFSMALGKQLLWWSPATADALGQYAKAVFDDETIGDLLPVATAWATWAGSKVGKDASTIAETVQALNRHLRPEPKTAGGLTLPGLGPNGDALDFFEDDEDDDFLDEVWARHEAEVGDFVRRYLEDHRGVEQPTDISRAAAEIRGGVASGHWPFATIAMLGSTGAIRIGEMSDTDVVLWAASVMIDPDPDPDALDDTVDLSNHPLAVAGTLEIIDWATVVISLTKSGAGVSCDPARLTALVLEGQEAGLGLDDNDDAGIVEHVFITNQPLWQAARITDAGDQLTSLGEWVLPRALCRTVGIDFD